MKKRIFILSLIIVCIIIIIISFIGEQKTTDKKYSSVEKEKTQETEKENTEGKAKDNTVFCSTYYSSLEALSLTTITYDKATNLVLKEETSMTKDCSIKEKPKVENYQDLSEYTKDNSNYVICNVALNTIEITPNNSIKDGYTYWYGKRNINNGKNSIEEFEAITKTTNKNDIQEITVIDTTAFTSEDNILLDAYIKELEENGATCSD